MDSWHQATLALRLLEMDHRLGGIRIRARAGPVREALIGQIDPNAQRIHPGVSDETLFGGLDLSATLSTGRLVHRPGLLQSPGSVVLSMAERTSPALAAKLALTLDQGLGHRVILLDEGVEADETAPDALTERLAFSIDLSDCTLRDIERLPQLGPKSDLFGVSHQAEAVDQITQVAADLGIDSLRAPLFALRAARAHAAISDRSAVNWEDIEIGCSLTLAHRATRIPEPQPAPEPPPPTEGGSEPETQNDSLGLPDELLLEAVRAMLPDGLLDGLALQKTRSGRGNGTGAARKGNRRGRPLPARAGRLQDDARIDLIGTLRAAAPWQTIRRTATGENRLHIQPGDFRLKRYEEKSDRLLIFTVDASGSSAVSRLAEAKGAVELLLAQAYARRDHVALVAFRGQGAELLLPPTRSLVQTKRRLAGLPGGGGTPLASGMMMALEQAEQAVQRGLTPTIAVLTDGRANITLDGRTNRAQAAKDTQQVARALRYKGVEAIVIDTGNRPEPALRNLAQTLDARYLPLPRADARQLSKSVSDALA